MYGFTVSVSLAKHLANETRISWLLKKSIVFFVLPMTQDIANKQNNHIFGQKQKACTEYVSSRKEIVSNIGVYGLRKWKQKRNT